MCDVRAKERQKKRAVEKLLKNEAAKKMKIWELDWYFAARSEDFVYDN